MVGATRNKVRFDRQASQFRCVLWCVILGLLLTMTSGVVVLSPAKLQAELKGPEATDRQVTLVVSSLLRREHLSKHGLDDEISRRGMDNFLDSLDPMKVYFTQADVDEFMENREKLDDMVRRGDISYAYTIFNRFLKRIDERMELVEEFLNAEHDFTVDENVVVDPDAARYAKNDEEVRNRWRKRIKFDLLRLEIDEEMSRDEAIEKLRRRYTSFAKRMHQTDHDELLERYLTAITTGFDPHTTYMSPSTLENFDISMKLNLEGIGAALMVEDGYTIVTKVIPGGAADRHGQEHPGERLQPQDRIVSVGQGTEGEMVETLDMKLSDVVQMIRGKADTVVRLGVIPDGETKTKIYTITRAKVELKDSEARARVREFGKKPDGSPFKVGIIDLPSFYMDMKGAREGLADYKSTTRDVRKILRDGYTGADGKHHASFKEQGVDALILDLRRNGGGSLTEAINLTGLFIDQGPVVQVKDADDRVQHYDDLDRGIAWDGPLVVVTSKFSASASEILAGAIQDYRRGIVVGDPATHGKGTVQSLLDLGSQLFRAPNAPNLGALKITMQQFYRPNGDSTQKRGVLADVSLPSITANMDIAESDLDFAIEFDRVSAAEYEPYDMVNEPIVKSLRQLSAERRSKDEEFIERMADIEKYIEQKERKVMPLHIEAFKAQREELNKDEEEEEQIKEQTEGDEKIFEQDYYNDEILAITRDYVTLLKENKVAKR